MIRCLVQGRAARSEITSSVPVDTVKSGAWDDFEPRWVKLFVDRFAVADPEGEYQWQELAEGCSLQGVLIRDTDERRTRRVYVASVAVPEQLAELSGNGRWPHVSQPTDPAAQESDPEDEEDEGTIID